MLRLSYRETLTPALKARIDALAPAGRTQFLKKAGRGVERLLKRHFRDRETSGANKHGFPRQHFWARIARATNFDPASATATSATVTISDPAINQKIHGGSIVAQPGKALAIPLRSRAYGHKPSDGTLPDLFLIKSRRSKKLFLAGLEGKGRHAKLVLYYILVKRTKAQAPDPNAMPPVTALNEEVRVAAVNHLSRLKA